MVPSFFTHLEAFPLTPNGKVNRSALPKPELNELGSGEPSEEPTSELERELASIFQGILGTGKVSPGDDFFELGGHSLLAMRLLTKVEESHGRRVRLATFFDNPTLRGVAEALEAREPVAQTAQEPSQRREALPDEASPGNTQAIADRMSPGQERLWQFCQDSDDASRYAMTSLTHIRGPIDRRRAFARRRPRCRTA